MEVGGKIVCKSCAEKMAAQPAHAQVVVKKEPALALLLSLVGGFLTGGLLLGLGQIYNGQIKKGIGICIANIFMGIVAIVLYLAISFITMGVGFVCCLPVLLVPVAFWLWALYDAYVTADKINNGEPIKDWLD
jgi:TM2 domain-containing membrane protein YozV